MGAGRGGNTGPACWLSGPSQQPLGQGGTEGPQGHAARTPKLQNGTLRAELKRHCPQRPSQPHLLANFLPSLLSPATKIPTLSAPVPLQTTRSQIWEIVVKHAQNVLGNRMHLQSLWTKNRLSPALPKAASSAGLSPQVASFWKASLTSGRDCSVLLISCSPSAWNSAWHRKGSINEDGGDGGGGSPPHPH